MTDLPAPFLGAADMLRGAAIPDPTRARTAAGIEAAAHEFEAVFLAQVMEHMFAGIETDGPFGGGHGESVYRSLLMQEYGKLLSERGGIGIADAVIAQLVRLQEVEAE